MNKSRLWKWLRGRKSDPAPVAYVEQLRKSARVAWEAERNRAAGGEARRDDS